MDAVDHRFPHFLVRSAVSLTVDLDKVALRIQERGRTARSSIGLGAALERVGGGPRSEGKEGRRARQKQTDRAAVNKGSIAPFRPVSSLTVSPPFFRCRPDFRRQPAIDRENDFYDETESKSRHRDLTRTSLNSVKAEDR